MLLHNPERDLETCFLVISCLKLKTNTFSVQCCFYRPRSNISYKQYKMSTGRKRDPVWIYFNKVPRQGKSGSRAKCKKCSEEKQKLKLSGVQLSSVQHSALDPTAFNIALQLITAASSTAGLERLFSRFSFLSSGQSIQGPTWN